MSGLSVLHKKKQQQQNKNNRKKKKTDMLISWHNFSICATSVCSLYICHLCVHTSVCHTFCTGQLHQGIEVFLRTFLCFRRFHCHTFKTGSVGCEVKGALSRKRKCCKTEMQTDACLFSNTKSSSL